MILLSKTNKLEPIHSNECSLGTFGNYIPLLIDLLESKIEK